MEVPPMKKNQKRLNLAVVNLATIVLILEFVNVVLDLLSKVVNYRESYI